jgi:hypothetical protein
MGAAVALSLYGHAAVAFVGDGGIGAGIGTGEGTVTGVRGLLVVVPIWLSRNLRACGGISSQHDPHESTRLGRRTGENMCSRSPKSATKTWYRINAVHAVSVHATF